MHLFFGVIVDLIAAIWVAWDARRRGMNAAGWAIGTFLLLILFLPLYLILRKPVIAPPTVYPPGSYPAGTYPPGSYPPGTYPPGPVRQCRNCGKPFEGDARFCPHCGAPLQ